MPYIRKSAFVKVAVLVLAGTTLASATAPPGWFIRGSKPAEYDSGIDASMIRQGHGTAFLEAKSTAIEGFGTLMQNFKAERYVNKRVRFTASVKTENVAQWAGLWMRVDTTKDSEPLMFDNMEDRPITGTTDWKKYGVVLDVPGDATFISIGVLLNGVGRVWLRDAQFDEVDGGVPTTGAPIKKTRWTQPRHLLLQPSLWTEMRPSQPMNLDFQN
jgi:hypothetical protein